MNGKLRVCRKCLPGQKNEEAFMRICHAIFSVWMKS